MSKDIKYGIIGLGRFGLSLAKSIIEGGDDVIAVDIDEDRTWTAFPPGGCPPCWGRRSGFWPTSGVCPCRS